MWKKYEYKNKNKSHHVLSTSRGMAANNKHTIARLLRAFLVQKIIENCHRDMEEHVLEFLRFVQERPTHGQSLNNARQYFRRQFNCVRHLPETWAPYFHVGDCGVATATADPLSFAPGSSDRAKVMLSHIYSFYLSLLKELDSASTSVSVSASVSPQLEGFIAYNEEDEDEDEDDDEDEEYDNNKKPNHGWDKHNIFFDRYKDEIVDEIIFYLESSKEMPPRVPTSSSSSFHWMSSVLPPFVVQWEEIMRTTQTSPALFTDIGSSAAHRLYHSTGPSDRERLTSPRQESVSSSSSSFFC